MTWEHSTEVYIRSSVFSTSATAWTNLYHYLGVGPLFGSRGGYHVIPLSSDTPGNECRRLVKVSFISNRYAFQGNIYPVQSPVFDTIDDGDIGGQGLKVEIGHRPSRVAATLGLVKTRAFTATNEIITVVTQSTK